MAREINPSLSLQESESLKILKELGLLRYGWFPSYDEFYHTVEPIMKKAAVHGQLEINDIAAMGNRWYSLLIIHNSGSPVFEIQPDLAKMLVETDLPSDISIELLHLPFEGIFLDFPSGILTDTGRTFERLSITCVPDDGSFRIVYEPDKETSTHINLHFSREELGISEDEDLPSIKKAVETTRKLIIEDYGRMSEDEVSSMRKSQTFDDYFESDIFTFAINAALYITSHGADVQEDKTEVREISSELQGEKKASRREKLLGLLKKAKNRKIYICGSNLKQSREMAAELTKEGRKLTKRFRVRGHWRNQAHGHGRTERKHVFIQPFWKGPTFAELLARDYVVRG